MFGVKDIMAVSPPLREDAFVLNRIHNRRITGYWDTGLLREMGLQILIMLAAISIFFGASSRILFEGIEEIQLAFMPNETGVADIVNRWTTRCGKNGGSACYHVRYRYDVAGNAYFAEEQIGYSLYTDTGREPRMQVTYAVDNPEIAHIGGPGIRTERMLPVAPILVLIIAFSLPLLFPLIEYLRVGRMLRKGTLVYGTIREINGYITGSGKNRRYRVRVSYAFIAPDGHAYNGEQKRTRSDLRNRTLPDPGTAVAIAYVDGSKYMML
ncbi:MAG: hypothetical protein IAE89_13450 [Anaerolineae bacterium]|nr:hypothetical protein [Anaerolineae bacterium]